MQTIPRNQLYTVVAGDNMVEIARKAGFRNLLTIYNHEQNLEFRYENPDPYILEPGSKIWIPERISKEETIETGKEHQFLAEAVASQQGLVLETGFVEDLVIVSETGESFDFRYEVPQIPQRENISAWGAGVAMLLAWRDEILVDLDAIANFTGYWQQYSNILSLKDPSIFQAVGMITKSTQEYTVDEFEQLLQEAYGPLWMVYGEPTANSRVRVVTGIAGDGTPQGTQVYISDTTSNRDAEYSETYQEFMEAEIFVACFPITETE